MDHRYERRKLSSSAVVPDPYNAVAYASSFSRANQQKAPLEYWTNGTTTLILNAGGPVSASLFSSSFSSINLSKNFVQKPVSAAATSGGDESESISSNNNSIRSHRNHSRPESRHNMQKQSDPNVVRNSLIAGSGAGVASTLACHPFDVIRTKMQAAAMESTLTTGGAAKSPLAAASPSGPIHVVSETLKNGGLRALYTGLALPLAAQAVYKSTVFTVNNVAQSFLVNWNTQERYKTGIFEPYQLTLSDRFLCGFAGGGVNAALFVTPVEYVRNQLIAQHSQRAAGLKIKNHATGPMDVVRNTVRNSPAGFLGLWKGLNVTIARDSIGCGFFFYAMEWSQRRFAHEDMENGRAPKLGITIFSGAMAGLAYWIAALPMDSVKTWVQSDMADSAVQAVRQSIRERGITETMHRLFSGFQVAYARGIPSAAITVTSYSLCYQALRDHEIV